MFPFLTHFFERKLLAKKSSAEKKMGNAHKNANLDREAFVGETSATSSSRTTRAPSSMMAFPDVLRKDSGTKSHLDVTTTNKKTDSPPSVTEIVPSIGNMGPVLCPAATAVDVPVKMVPPESKQQASKSTKKTAKQGAWEFYQAPDIEAQPNMIFPLSRMPDVWQIIGPHAQKVDCGHADFRQIHAAKVSLEALLDVYNLVHPGWYDVRDKIKVGLYKETETCGNTSVSIGFGRGIFPKKPNESMGCIY